MARWDTVQSVVYERTDFYYDLHVPWVEHYLADGMFSHNTGKTRGVLENDHNDCLMYPGIRVLWVRQTKQSLAESIMVTFEEKVLGPFHPLIQGPTREHRQAYRYPNRSTIVLAGLDQPSRTFSMEYDKVSAFEAIETILDAWEKLIRVNRNGVLPWQQMVAETNPGPEDHWANHRADQEYSAPAEFM